jgi:hypothetical protein
MLAVYGQPISNYQVYNNTLLNINRFGVEYFCSADLSNNIIQMQAGTLIKASSTAKFTELNDIEYIGDISGLKLDLNYNPGAGSIVPLDAGYNPILREAGTLEVETIGGVTSIYVRTPSGKRIKIE